ncbi:hypothetical protein D3C73_403760 [compost metagenome]
MLNGFVDIAVGNQLDNPAFLDRREYIDRLQRDIFTVQHSAGNPVGLGSDILLKIRNQLIKKSAVNHLSGFRQNFSSGFINQRLCQTLVKQPVLNVQLLIDFVTAYIGQVIALWIEETCNQKALGIIQCRRFARTQTLVDFNKRLLRGVRIVFIQRIANIFIITKQFQNFSITAETESTQKHCNWNFTGPVDTDIHDILSVGLQFKPGSAVWNYCGGVGFFAVLIYFRAEIDAWRANQLADNNPFRTIDNKSAGLRHQREISHEHFLLFDLTGLLIDEPHLHTQRSRICHVPLFSVVNRILRFA